ncbi:MAG: carbon-nitrogen hydrolase family protein [Tatlockia sp.]|nr:carbon-nitrogen hydrolase family protein [Tatlockia sp.]
MTVNESISIAVFQGEIKQGNSSANLEKTIEQLFIAESRGIDILCMPESFLHGYFESKKDALINSIDLATEAYLIILEKLKPFNKTTLLLGLNERQGNQVFNSVVVIENGKHIGKYSKAYTYPPYDYFSLGKEFPIFEKKGIRYGIIICIDSAYHEPTHILALKGAQLIFCPMYNRVANDARMLSYLNRKSHFIARAFENECWLACSDITLENDGEFVCPGSATILDKNGEVVCLSNHLEKCCYSTTSPLNLSEMTIGTTIITEDYWVIMSFEK